MYGRVISFDIHFAQASVFLFCKLICKVQLQASRPKGNQSRHTPKFVPLRAIAAAAAPYIYMHEHNFRLNQRAARYNHQQRFIRRRANEMCLVSNSSNNNEYARGNDAPQSTQQPHLARSLYPLQPIPMGGDNVISR
jgi:hypothetical protein